LDFIQTVLAFVVTLGVLVTIHEWGHFIVARICGVKVLRFSLGFGKVLFSVYDKKGTEFALAAIPLGGYVKMFGEQEESITQAQKKYAFSHKNVYQRFAIVVAGPAVNLIFAVLVYWFLFVGGTNTIAPIIGSLNDGSIAAQAQLPVNGEIVEVDGEVVNNWQDVNLVLAGRIGETGVLSFTVKGGQGLDSFNVRKYNAELKAWYVDLEKQSPLSAVGIIPFRPDASAEIPVINTVSPQGRAAKAGMEEGDLVVAIDDKSVANWGEVVEIVQRSPAKQMQFSLLRSAESINIYVTPDEKKLESGAVIGFIGVGVKAPQWPEKMIRVSQLGVAEGFVQAASNTWRMVSLTFDSIKKMIEGLISVKNLSGPITIAKVASDNAQSGLESYLSFLAYLSISLGVLNLLPIPMLDGGHLFYYAIEMIKGKPVSEKIQAIGLRIGMALLFCLMATAMFNDLMRL